MRLVAMTLLIILAASTAVPPAHTVPGGEGSLLEETRTSIPFNAPWVHAVVIGSPRVYGNASPVQPPVFRRILSEIKAINPYVVISTGDNTRSGTRREIDAFYAAMRNLRNVLAAAGETDMRFPGNAVYWRQRVAPGTFYSDAVPGWRIIVLNTSMGINQLSRADVMAMYDTPRHRIVVVHEPIEPELVVNGTSYNMGPRKRFWLRAVFADEEIDIVLQGHYPGYAETVYRGTHYIVTGGAGPGILPGEKNHYLVLILYPDGRYTVEPVSAENGSLAIYATGSTVVVNNTKKTIDGSPAAVPVSINLARYTGLPAEAVVLAEPGVTVVNYTVADNRLVVHVNASAWYLVYNGTAYRPRRGVVTVSMGGTASPAPGAGTSLNATGANATASNSSTGGAGGGGESGGAGLAGLVVAAIAVAVLVLVAAAIRMLR